MDIMKIFRNYVYSADPKKVQEGFDFLKGKRPVYLCQHVAKGKLKECFDRLMDIHEYALKEGFIVISPLLLNAYVRDMDEESAVKFIDQSIPLMINACEEFWLYGNVIDPEMQRELSFALSLDKKIVHVSKNREVRSDG